MNETIKAPEAEAVIETKPVEEVKVETIGKVLETETPKETTVPEAAFLGEKKARKAAEKELKALKASIEAGASTEEVSSDIDAIAEEHNIDKKFLKQLATSIRKDAEREIEGKLADKLKPMEARDRAEKIETVFATHFDKAMAEMPEYKEIVNRNVIKTLSLDPANQNKTFAQLIEETYGNAIGGKRTLETTTPRGGKASGEIDYDRASRDPSYYKEIMSDPDAKKKYNESLTDRLSMHL